MMRKLIIVALQRGEKMDDLISRQAAIYIVEFECGEWSGLAKTIAEEIKQLPSAQPDIIRCKDCKHNPKLSWFGCPMSHLSEAQRPETAWCWKAERREVTT